jgi:hypothetical protein
MKLLTLNNISENIFFWVMALEKLTKFLKLRQFKVYLKY